MKSYLYLIGILVMILGLTIASFAEATKSGYNTVILTKNQTVSLNLPIDAQTATSVQQALLQKAKALRSKDPIYLVLNSPGGSVVDGQRIIETAKGLPNEVHTITMFSASMSFIVSQYLNKRYILESGIMMSHPASASGLAGQVPGSLITRALALLASIRDLETQVAARARLPLSEYEAMIANELWLTGVEAVERGFADRVIRVQCDYSLQGAGEVQTLQTLFGPVKVTWHACPLITEPYAIEFGNLVSENDKREFIKGLYSLKSRGVGYVSPVNENITW